MTALSANTNRTLRNPLGMTRTSIVVKTSSVLYQGALCARAITGKGLPAANATTTTFVGMVVIDNPDDATAGITGDGTLRAECISDVTVLMALATVVTAGDAGEAMYAADDNTATTSNTLGPVIGTLEEFVSANLGYVKLGAPALARAS